MATWRMSILRNFSHFPLVGPGWGIFSLSLSKLVLISPCLCLSRALASFLRYLDMPALRRRGLGPLFLGPETTPSSDSSFLFCLNLYLHLAASDMSVISVSRDMLDHVLSPWVFRDDWQCEHFRASVHPPTDLHHQPQNTWAVTSASRPPGLQPSVTARSTVVSRSTLKSPDLDSAPHGGWRMRTGWWCHAVYSGPLNMKLEGQMMDFHCPIKVLSCQPLIETDKFKI